MNSLATNIRELLVKSINEAPASDVLAIASQLCAAEPKIKRPSPILTIADRFTKLDSEGNATTGDWVAVHDAKTDLTWTRTVLDGEFAWKDALAACAKVDLFGKSDWRAPTIQEQLSIIDYERCDPAVDTDYFDGEVGWCWTSTPAKAPAGCAWGVGLYDGGSYRSGQADHTHVRAVRAGQQLALGV